MSSPTPDVTSHFSDIIVRAGAGAGKTRDLVHKVLDLEEEVYRKEGRHAHLVVTTFTRKATQELRERLLALALERKKDELVDFVQRPSQLHISTIHGILSVYLMRFGGELGLGPQFKILSQAQLKKFSKRVFRQILKSKPELGEAVADLLEVQDLDRLLLTLESYFSLWCQNKVRRATVDDLELSFLQEIKSWQEKIEELAGWIATENPNEKWQLYGDILKTLSQQMASTKSLAEIRKAIGNFIEHGDSPRKTVKVSEELAELKNQIHKKIESWTETRYSDSFFQEHERLTGRLERVAEEFSQTLLRQKIRTGFLSLTDLELLAFRLAQQFPRSAELFSKEWDFWLVDEYQDTSPLQVELLRLLIGTRKNYIVGDPQQSIYLFRGARSEVFREKELAIEKAQGENLLRMTNYRSRPEVLHFINDIFTNANSKQFQAMDVGYSRELKYIEPESVQYILCQSIDEEIHSALTRVQELRNQGIPLEQICILARTNELLENLAFQAKFLSLPVQVHSSSRFSIRREVQDAIALLKFFVNPSDNFGFLQLLRSPWLKVNDRHLQKITKASDTSYFIQALQLADQEEWRPVQTLNHYLLQSKETGISTVWVQALVELGVFDLGAKFDPSGRREANLWKLVSLVKQAEKQPGFSILEFLEQLTDVQVESEGDGDATPVVEPKRVNLMTVHASKGLQFQYVIVLGAGKRPQVSKTEFFLADTETGIWTLSLMDPEQDKQVASPLGSRFLEEKKQRELFENERVFYVALTRAVLGVSLIWSDVNTNSWASLIPLEIRNQTLSPEEEVLGETENYSFKIRGGPLASIQPPQHSENREIVLREKFRARLDPSHNDRQSTSVTEILEGRGPKAEKNSQASLKGLEKALRGVEIHRLFEGLKYKTNFAQDNAEFQKALSFLKTWQGGKLLEVLQNGEVEWGFAILKDQTVLQGQIDLWGNDNQGEYFVVDYKTGSQTYLEKAFQQLEIYASALRQMGKVPKEKPLHLLVVYPLEESIHQRLF